MWEILYNSKLDVVLYSRTICMNCLTNQLKIKVREAFDLSEDNVRSIGLSQKMIHEKVHEKVQDRDEEVQDYSETQSETKSEDTMDTNDDNNRGVNMKDWEHITIKCVCGAKPGILTEEKIDLISVFKNLKI